MKTSNYVANFRQSNKSNDFIKSENEENEHERYIKWVVYYTNCFQ